jgi:quinol monooxygenase YgiN
MKFGMQAVITTHAGKGDELAELLVEAAAILQSNDECEVYLIQVAINEPDKIYISEVWSNEQAHKASLTNPAVRAVITRAMPFIAQMEAKPTRSKGGKLSTEKSPG